MLTRQENKIHMLHSAGFSAEEIAQKISVEPNTVRKHLDNIKKKVGWSKASELAGFGICEFLGLNYSEVRQKILSTVLLLMFVASFHITDRQVIRRPSRTGRRHEIEYVLEC